MITIVPAIDIMEGNLVRLYKGRFENRKAYETSPVEFAREVDGQGIEVLHLVDLDGARSGKVVNWDVIRGIVENTKLKVDFGGGIQSTEDVNKLFQIGVNQINTGSIAAKQPELYQSWIREFGPDRIILSADTRNKTIYVDGWQKDTGLGISDFIRQSVELGIRHISVTSIEKDGMMTGPDNKLYRDLCDEFPEISFTASGGVSAVEDIIALESTGVSNVIVGKAILDGRISLEKVKEINSKEDVD